MSSNTRFPAAPAVASGPGQGQGQAEELLLVLKWGGVLTHAGRKQAEVLGTAFRAVMYPRWAMCHDVSCRVMSRYVMPFYFMSCCVI